MKEGKMKSIVNIVRYIWGSMLIITGLSEISTNEIVVGLLFVIWGISFFQIVYEKTKLNKYKKIEIILPIILFFILVIVMPDSVDTNAKIEESDIVESISKDSEEKVKITGLEFEEIDIVLDLNESKEVVLRISPIDASCAELEVSSTDLSIAKIEKNTEKSNENQVYLNIYAVGEGECEVFATANGVESNRIKITIIDKQRIEQEDKANTEQVTNNDREQSKNKNDSIKSETASEKSNGSGNKTNEEKYEESNSTSNITEAREPEGSSSTSNITETKANEDSTSRETNNNSNGKSIYRTPKGARYHFDPDCGGPNSYLTTLNDAISAGLTPCKKCAQ